MLGSDRRSDSIALKNW